MSTRIEDLEPDMQFKVKAFVAILKEKAIPYFVTSTKRTLAEQAALYAQGRLPLPAVNELRETAGLHPIGAENYYTVTNCDGVKHKSNHQSGRAIDIVPKDDKGNPNWPSVNDGRWKKIAEVGETVGLSWGGRWSPPDNPHYQLEVT